MVVDALVIAAGDGSSYLVGSKLAPRLHSRLSEAAAYVHSAEADVASEEKDISLLIMSWQNLAETVLDEMSKGRIDRSAALGYVRVLHKISDLLTRKMFPTPMLVRQELMSLDTVQTREKKNVDDYFAIGGLAEHALDAVLSRAKDILEDGAGDDGESEEEESDTYEEEDDTSMSRKRGRDPAEIPAPPRITRSRSVSPVTTLRAAFLPEMYELDENLPLVRNMLLGPSRNGKNAPFAPPQTQEEAEKRMKMVRLRDNAVLQLEKKQKLEKALPRNRQVQPLRQICRCNEFSRRKRQGQEAKHSKWDSYGQHTGPIKWVQSCHVTVGVCPLASACLHSRLIPGPGQ